MKYSFRLLNLVHYPISEHKHESSYTPQLQWIQNIYIYATSDHFMDSRYPSSTFKISPSFAILSVAYEFEKPRIQSSKIVTIVALLLLFHISSPLIHSIYHNDHWNSIIWLPQKLYTQNTAPSWMPFGKKIQTAIPQEFPQLLWAAPTKISSASK